MNHPKRILVLGAYGTGNLGDELILDSLMQLLGRAYPGSDFRVLSYDASVSEGFHDIPALEIPPFASSRKQLSAVLRGRLGRFTSAAKARRAVEEWVDWCDLFVLGGGNLLTDHPFYFLEHFTGQIVRVAANRGKPVAVLGAGFGPINTKKGQRLLEELGGWAGAVALREAAGAEACKAAGFADPRVTGDPVLLAPPFMDNVVREPIQRAVVSLRPVANGAALPDSVVAAIEAVKGRLEVAGLAMDPSPDSAPLRTHLGASFCLDTPTPANVVTEVRRSSLVIGMRLHACIVAAAFGVPVVPIAYHHKVTAFAESLGVDWLPMDGRMSAAQATSLVADTIDDLGDRRKQLATRVGAQRLQGLTELEAALAALPFDPPTPITPQQPPAVG
ncbi:MAG: polysaccharide pyruvyl transferase family protein [Longimicrobiales bacterium]